MDFPVIKKALFLFCLIPLFTHAQYTDVINSNRPGRAVSAYAVGRNVVQGEMGLLYEQQDNADLNTDSNILGVDFSLRYGLLFETLELNWEGSFITQNVTFTNLGTDERRTDFSRNRLGLKFLIFDPYKNPERSKPNLYSWRANNVFQWKNLIPAVSVYAGATFTLGENPFYVGDPVVAPRAAIATQSRLSPRFVLISNLAYDRIGTDFPELNFAMSITHAFRDPKWSVFLEGQGISSDRYSDVLLRTGVAYLINENFQADFHLGSGFKNSPSRIFTVLGFSYRLDFHKDKLVAISDQKGGKNGKIKKGAAKKKRKKSKKKKKDKLDF
ncbi:transporter [Flagellimonas flava]|uniref:Putative MetA-pathway of phenol degradation n=1 Tax=Flagellimonas flava TaxID=570519 RepID=A0A1M5J194_9FLAO|nr:transporter [Allomuricauda flava]SHG34069.1 Putative MetA-pathway of phenol degradation [Allomuricauda flava]